MREKIRKGKFRSLQRRKRKAREERNRNILSVNFIYSFTWLNSLQPGKICFVLCALLLKIRNLEDKRGDRFVGFMPSYVSMGTCHIFDWNNYI